MLNLIKTNLTSSSRTEFMDTSDFYKLLKSKSEHNMDLYFNVFSKKYTSCVIKQSVTENNLKNYTFKNAEMDIRK